MIGLLDLQHAVEQNAELAEALYEEWIENHDRKCGVSAFVAHSCNHPMPKILQEKKRQDIGFIVG